MPHLQPRLAFDCAASASDCARTAYTARAARAACFRATFDCATSDCAISDCAQLGTVIYRKSILACLYCAEVAQRLCAEALRRVLRRVCFSTKTKGAMFGLRRALRSPFAHTLLDTHFFYKI